jgi:hypothetical protein
MQGRFSTASFDAAVGVRAEQVLFGLFLPQLREEPIHPPLQLQITPNTLDALDHGPTRHEVPINAKAMMVIYRHFDRFLPITHELGFPVITAGAIKGGERDVGGHFVVVSIVGLLVNQSDDGGVFATLKLDVEPELFKPGLV